MDHSCMNDEVRQICLEEIVTERSRLKEGDARNHRLLDRCVDSLTPIPFSLLVYNQLTVANVLLPSAEMKIGLSREISAAKKLTQAGT